MKPTANTDYFPAFIRTFFYFFGQARVHKIAEIDLHPGEDVNSLPAGQGLVCGQLGAQFQQAKAVHPAALLSFQAEGIDPYWISLELARRLLTAEEYETHFKPFEEGGIELLWEKQLAGLKGVSAEDKEKITIDYLKQNGIWNGKAPKPKPKAKTPTHKLEIFSTFLASAYAELEAEGDSNSLVANPLPVWQPSKWMTIKEKLGKDEFIPITGFAPINSFTGQQTKDNRLLANVGEALAWDAVFINTTKGKALGLAKGDMVTIWNPDNKMEQTARVILSELVHPDAMFSYYGAGPGAFKNLNKFYSNAPKTGFNPNHSAPYHHAPLVGGHAAHDFIIKMRRA